MLAKGHWLLTAATGAGIEYGSIWDNNEDQGMTCSISVKNSSRRVWRFLQGIQDRQNWFVSAWKFVRWSGYSVLLLSYNRDLISDSLVAAGRTFVRALSA